MVNWVLEGKQYHSNELVSNGDTEIDEAKQENDLTTILDELVGLLIGHLHHPERTINLRSQHKV